MSSLAEAAKFQSWVDADVARMLLESHGIGTVLFDREINTSYGGLFMPVRVMVLEEDLRAAIDLLVENALL